jgi:hypothetical protein
VLLKQPKQQSSQTVCFMVMNAVKKNYMPQDMITKVEFCQELLRIKMNGKADPSTLFEQLAKIKLSVHWQSSMWKK